MKKVSIIYWSNGGNVEILANAISEGVNSKEVEVETKHQIFMINIYIYKNLTINKFNNKHSFFIVLAFILFS